MAPVIQKWKLQKSFVVLLSMNDSEMNKFLVSLKFGQEIKISVYPVTGYCGIDLERYLPLFSMAEGPSTSIWEASFLPHTQYENIKTKLFITAMSKLLVFACFSSQEDMRVWKYIY